MSDIIMGVVISDKLLTLISNTYKNKLAKSEHIIAIVNRLRKDNGMPPLPKNNFEFNTGDDKWHEETQTMGVWYSLSNPDLYKTFDNSFHEFRHSHQNFYKNDETKVSKEVSENLDGYIDDGELYYLQPCECDANEFSKALMNLIIEKCNLPFKKRNDYELGQYKKGQIENKNKFRSYGYPPTNEFFSRIFHFQSSINIFNSTSTSDKNFMSFSTNIFDICLIKENNTFHYKIFNKNNDAMLQASCKNNTCYINCVDLFDNPIQSFREIMDFNNEIIKLYNSEFNKNIQEIKFNPVFGEIHKSMHNKLIKNYFNLSIFSTIKDPFLEQSFSIKLDKNSILESEYNNSIINSEFKSTIIKIKDHLNVDEIEYKNLKQLFPFLKEAPNELINKLLNDQIRYYQFNMNKILNGKEIYKNLEYLKYKTQIKNLKNILPVNDYIDETKVYSHGNYSFGPPIPPDNIVKILEEEGLTVDDLNLNIEKIKSEPIDIQTFNISKDDDPR